MRHLYVITAILLTMLCYSSKLNACDNTPLLVVYDPVEIGAGQWDLEVFVCFGSEESEDGFTLESTDGSVNILNATPSLLENPVNGNYAEALFSGGILNYYYDNSAGDNYNDATGETGPCVDFTVTVDTDPTGTSFTMAGVNDGCEYTITDEYLTSEVTFTPNCNADQTLVAPGAITGNTENSSTICNFRSPVFGTVKEKIIEVVVPCDGEYTFSLCNSNFDTWMAISYQCCFLPFVSNNDYCGLQSEITTELLAGTYYVLVEGFLWDDYGDFELVVTSSTDAVAINNIEVSQPQCSTSDAEIIIHAEGDDPPFQYSIDGGATFFNDSVFSNLGGGNYSIFIQSQSGCIASTLLSINTNPPLTLDGIIATDASCGEENGSITINVSDGLAPYEYSIDNGLNYVSTNVFSNLAGGNYLISTLDANGCSVNSVFELDSTTTPIILSIDIMDPSCALATGQISISASGDSELSYSIDGINFQASPIFTGLVAADYTITVASALSCTIDSIVSLVDQGAPYFDQININQSSCDATGSIEIIAAGGGGIYQYSIDGGLTFVSSNLFTDLPSTGYTLSIRDNNLCIIDSLVYLPQNTSINIDSLQLLDPICDPSNGNITDNGEIEIFASGGISTLQYSIDGGSNYQSDSLFTGLSYGAYLISVSDGTCTIDSLVSLATNPGPIIDILDFRDLTCGEENGFIAVKVLNPSDPDYIYEFDNGIDNIQSTPTTDDQYSYDLFSEGIWNIIVTDGDGCKGDTAIELTIIPDIAITDVIVDSVTCGQNNGAFTVFASSGNLPIEYSLSSDFLNSQGNGFFSGLSAGNYNVYLRDERMCLDTISIDLINQTGLGIDSIVSQNPTCLDHNGEITIYVSQGVEPYFYSVDNGLTFQSGNFFSGLHDETYEIMVLDASGCVVTSSVTLEVEGEITIDIDTNPVSCNSQNGEISIVATGPNTNFTYYIDNGVSQSNTTGLFIDLLSGGYSVFVEDEQGCSAMDSAFVDSIPGPQIDTAYVGHTSCGEMNGEIEIWVSSGSSPYEYSIDNGLSFQNDSLFSNLSSGNYSIVIRDSLLCTDSLEVEVQISTSLAIAAIITVDPSCGDSSGSAIIIVEDAIPPLDFILNGIDTNTTGVFENLNAGTYNIEVIDSLLCSADSVFVLTDSIAPPPNAETMPDASSCQDTIVVTANNAEGNTGLWTVIEGNAQILNASDSITLASGLSVGSNVFVWSISNSNCPASSDTLVIDRIEEASVDAGEDQYYYAIVPALLGATANFEGDYLWTPSSNLSDPTIPNPVALVEENTQFIVNVSNNQGCSASDSMWVYFINDINYASAFTPDGDGNNDLWVIENIEYFPDAVVTIVNRYGNTVFESKGYTEAWDGKYNGQDVPVGSYFFVIDLGEGIEQRTGSISVIR